MSPAAPNRDLQLRLDLVGVPESAGLVRALVRSAGRSAALDPVLVQDICTAVSEACNNAVLHGYADAPGPLAVTLAVRADGIEVVVRDQGGGIRAGAAPNRGLGMGLPLIHSLAERVEVESSDLGTAVRMSFSRARHSAPEPADEVSSRGAGPADRRSSGAPRAR